MEPINYDGRVFRLVSSSTGDVDTANATLFHYHQTDDIVTCEYSGGSVRVGRMIGTVNRVGILTIRFEHIYTDGHMASGKGVTMPELVAGRLLRLNEEFIFLDTGEEGFSVVEEIDQQLEDTQVGPDAS